MLSGPNFRLAARERALKGVGADEASIEWLPTTCQGVKKATGFLSAAACATLCNAIEEITSDDKEAAAQLTPERGLPLMPLGFAPVLTTMVDRVIETFVAPRKGVHVAGNLRAAFAVEYANAQVAQT